MERHGDDRETTPSRKGIRQVMGRLGLCKSTTISELSPESEIDKFVAQAVREGHLEAEARAFAERWTAAGFRVFKDDNLGFRPEDGQRGDIPLRGEGTNAVRAARIIGNARRGQPLEGQ